MIDLVKKLCSAKGVSGNEKEVCSLVYSLMFPLADVAINEFGNVIAVFGNKNADKTILLDAHIDQIGFIVTDITPKGFLKVEKCGGIDLRTILGCGVIVDGKQAVRGIVCCMPPHLSDGN